MSEREDRFNELYSLACSRIIAYAMRRTRSAEDAGDVVAQTFEIAWRKLDEVPSEDAGVLWLYVTARNVLANHGRRLRRHDALTARLAEELWHVPKYAESVDDERVVMRSCLDGLDADDREVLLLAGWEGLRANEIAHVLGCSSTAARIRLHRARSRLKDAMAEFGFPEALPLFPTRATGVRGHQKPPEEVLEG
jgi:RNA polymerase sigma-70 factor (ECF subfamily)